VIVVSTDDFELYHDLVGELRDRGVEFTTVEPGDPLPDRAQAVVRGPDDPPVAADADRREAGPLARVVAAPGDSRGAVDDVLAALRGGEGRTVVGVDPGERPGIAVLSGGEVVAAFHVPLADAADRVRAEVADDVSPLVRVGDGARLHGARLLDALDDVPVEVVDETGTTPHLGAGARGMGDVLAAVNIARREGERGASPTVEPTAGELQRIKDESRRRSTGDRTIDERLARRVAAGDLTVEEALEEHGAE
jgi:hypothetical protein